MIFEAVSIFFQTAASNMGLPPNSAALISLVAGAALGWLGVIIYFRQNRHSHYGELDRIYFDIIGMRVNNPGLVEALPNSDPKITEFSRNQYSYMMWTFLETIYDRAVESSRLQLTWQPIIRTEGLLHIHYIAQPNNANAFQDGFIEFIRRGGFDGYCDTADETKANRQFAEDVQKVLGKPKPLKLKARFGKFMWRRRKWFYAAGVALCVGLLAAYVVGDLRALADWLRT